MEKKELVAELKEIIPVMDRVDQYNQKLDGIWQRMEILKSQINEPYKAGFFTNNKGWMWGLLGGMLVARIIFTPFLGIIEKSSILTLIFIVIVAAMIVVGIRISLKISKQRFEQKKEPCRQELERREQEYENIEQEMLAELAPHWQRIQAVIPQDYIAPMFVRAAYGYLVNGRADSMKEAINLFEEEQHRWRMEQGQQQMYEQYQAEIRSLQEATRELELRVSAAEYDASAARASAVKDW